MIRFEEGIPIYQQIVAHIKAQMMNGSLKAGDKLPSVRELAETYQVNPNTIQRVFMELEKDQLTYSERGIGNFVRKDQGLMEELKQEEVDRITQDFIHHMVDLGFDGGGILEKVKQKIREADHD